MPIELLQEKVKAIPAEYVGEVSDFYIVQLGNNQVGYVSKNYVKKSSKVPSGAATYENMMAKTATISGDSVNLRRGPSTSFSKVTKLNKGQKVKVIGKINYFYLAITEDNTVGMISKNYVDLTGKTESTNTSTSLKGKFHFFSNQC